MNSVIYCKLTEPIYKKASFIGWKVVNSILILGDKIEDTNIVIYWPPAKLRVNNSIYNKLPGYITIKRTADFFKANPKSLANYIGKVTSDEIEGKIGIHYNIKLNDTSKEFYEGIIEEEKRKA